MTMKPMISRITFSPNISIPGVTHDQVITLPSSVEIPLTPPSEKPFGTLKK